MFPLVAQRPTQDMGSSGDKGNDAEYNRQEAHREAIRIEDTEQPRGRHVDQHRESGHAEPERDAIEPQKQQWREERSLNSRRKPAVFRLQSGSFFHTMQTQPCHGKR